MVSEVNLTLELFLQITHSSKLGGASSVPHCAGNVVVDTSDPLESSCNTMRTLSAGSRIINASPIESIVNIDVPTVARNGNSSTFVSGFMIALFDGRPLQLLPTQCRPTKRIVNAPIDGLLLLCLGSFVGAFGDGPVVSHTLHSQLIGLTSAGQDESK